MSHPESAPPTFKYGKRRVMLNVRVLMAQKGFRSVAGLHRALIQLGCDISHPQLTRIVDNHTKMISIDVLDALINLFDCPPGDLIIQAAG